MNSHRELQRVEAFSDGVFAIACTLLILELKVPHVEDMGEPAGSVVGAQSRLAIVCGIHPQFRVDPRRVGGASSGREPAREIVEGLRLCQWLPLAHHHHAISDGRARATSTSPSELP